MTQRLLPNDEIPTIRAAIHDGELSYRQAAAYWKVSVKTIQNIVSGERYADVPDPGPYVPPTPEQEWLLLNELLSGYIEKGQTEHADTLRPYFEDLDRQLFAQATRGTLPDHFRLLGGRGILIPDRRRDRSLTAAQLWEREHPE